MELLAIPPIPVLTTLLQTQWDKLAETKTKQDADRLLESTTGLSTMADFSLSNKFCLQWDDVCPSCFDFDFKDPPPALGSKFSLLVPNIQRMIIVLTDCEVLDDLTGQEIKKTIHLEVISCAPNISFLEADSFKFRAANEVEHTNYKTFVPMSPPLGNDSKKIEYWQLLRSTGPDSQVLSLIRSGCLDSTLKKKVSTA